MPNVFLRCGLMTICALAAAGCGPSTPRERLIGRWKGSPQVKEAVDEMVQSASQGQEVNPLAQGAARFLGSALAKATMWVEIDMRPSGTVFVTGNTELVGLPPDAEGEWSVVTANDDVAHVEFEIAGRIYPAKIVLRDADEFMLKMEPPAAPVAAKPAELPAVVPAEKPVATVRDEDKTLEDDDTPAQPAPIKPAPAPVSAAPAAAQPGPGAPAKKPAEAILFKRTSS
jgi:hypothetical protein